MVSLRSLVWLFAGLVFSSLLGCTPKDEITAYQAPTEVFAPRQRNPVRLLAVIAPVGDRDHWVFKVSGPEAVVNGFEKDLMSFFTSIRLSAERDEEKMPKIEWLLPTSWNERKGGGEFRYKTIDLPHKDGKLELTVSHFPRKPRMLENVNRWRDQINRNPITPKELDFVTRPIELKEGKGTLVDVRGYEFAVPEPADEFQYDKPADWTKTPGGVAFAKLAFVVGEAPKLARVTVTNAGGTAEDNLNRWRKQLGLAPLGREELMKSIQHLPVAGTDGLYIDYATEANAALGSPIERILGVIFRLDGDQWMVKMSGPRDLLAAQKPNFERFVRSLNPGPK